MDNVKQKRLEYLKYRRNLEEISPINVNGENFDFDETAQSRLMFARDFLNRHDNVVSIEWTTADNTETFINVDIINVLIDKAFERSNNVHIKYRRLYERVMQATTYEEIMSIEW